MTSRNDKADGGMRTEPWDMPIGAPITEPHAEPSVHKYGAALSLGEAEDIAERRLRELAIRLGDDDTEETHPESYGNRAPFDADRHFRSRLAERIAGQTVHKPTAHPPSCPVTDALPLSAFGEGFAAISRWSVSSVAQHGLAVVDMPTDAQSIQPFVVDKGGEPVVDRDLGHALRLADLIQEQRALLDRLSGIVVAGSASASGLSADDLSELVNGSALTFALPSDAEQLFDGGTHAAEPLHEQVFDGGTHAAEPLHEQDDDVVAVPAAISAEQLIAALKEVVPMASAGPRFPVEHQAKAEAGSFEEHIVPSTPELAADVASDRPPMIIERARAELTALANGELAHPRPPPSGLVGFVAGLSLSVVVGISLYFAL